MFSVPPVITAVEPTPNIGPAAPNHLAPSIPIGITSIVSAPDRVWDFVRPVALDGVFTGRNPTTGEIAVQTALGTLILAGDAALQPGSPLSILITPGAPPSASLFGPAAQPGAAAAENILSTPAVLIAEAADSAQLALAPGTMIRLTPVGTPGQASPVIPTGGQAAALPASADAMPQNLLAGSVADPTASPVAASQGSEAQIVAVALSLAPSVRPSPQQAGKAASAGLASLLAAELEQPIAGEASAVQLPPGVLATAAEPTSPFAAQILAVIPPDMDIPVEAMLADTFAATVDGTTLAGDTVLASEDGPFILAGTADLDPGTTLILRKADPAPPGHVPLPAPLDPIRGRAWPALEAALALMAIEEPDIAAAARSALPQPGPMLGPAMALLLSGLSRNEAESWSTGKLASALRRAGRGDLAARLDDDFLAAARQYAAPLRDGWHAAFLPLLVGEKVTGLQFFVRQADDQQPDDAAQPAAPGIRFVVEADPIATGPLQIDGLIRGQQSAGRKTTLDLILRSSAPLPADMRAAIQQIFRTALDATGLAGGLAFQGNAQWIKIARERGTGPSVIA